MRSHPAAAGSASRSNGPTLTAAAGLRLGCSHRSNPRYCSSSSRGGAEFSLCAKRGRKIQALGKENPNRGKQNPSLGEGKSKLLEGKSQPGEAKSILRESSLFKGLRRPP